MGWGRWRRRNYGPPATKKRKAPSKKDKKEAKKHKVEVELEPYERPKHTYLYDMPQEVLENIMMYLPFKSIVLLSKESIRFYNIIRRESFWNKIKLLKTEVPRHIESIPMPRFIQLVSGKGCEICGKETTRKVNWAFKVRACTECIKARTVTEGRLVRNSVDRRIYSSLPFSDSHDRQRGYSFIRSYWEESVDDLIALHASIREMPDYEQQCEQLNSVENQTKHEIHLQLSHQRTIRNKFATHSRYSHWSSFYESDGSDDSDVYNNYFN